MVINKVVSFTKLISNYKFLSILLLGFSAGIPLALTGSTLGMWLSRLDIDVKTIGLFALVAVPFSFKYIWSAVFDYVPLPYFTKKFGLRKSWLILSQVCLMLLIIALGNTSPLENITITAIIALLVSFSSASQDIIIDALRIEILEKQEQGLGATMYVYGYRIAMLVSGAGSLLLADYISWSSVYFVMSFSILIGIGAVIFLDEPEHPKERLIALNNFSLTFRSIVNYVKNAKWIYILLSIVISYRLFALTYIRITGLEVGYAEIFTFIAVLLFVLILNRKYLLQILPEPILDFCQKPQWLYIILFIISYKLADTLIATVQSKFYVNMGFSNSEIAYITKGLGFIMTLFGLFIGGIIYYRMGIFKSLLISGILQMASNVLFIWVAQQQHDLVALSVTIAIENFTGAVNNVVIVAYLSSLCNIAYTATQYALLSSFSTLGRTIISAPAGFFVASLGWIKFFIFTALAGIPSIILLYIIFQKDLKNGNR